MFETVRSQTESAARRLFCQVKRQHPTVDKFLIETKRSTTTGSANQCVRLCRNHGAFTDLTSDEPCFMVFEVVLRLQFGAGSYTIIELGTVSSSASLTKRIHTDRTDFFQSDVELCYCGADTKATAETVLFVVACQVGQTIGVRTDDVQQTRSNRGTQLHHTSTRTDSRH